MPLPQTGREISVQGKQVPTVDQKRDLPGPIVFLGPPGAGKGTQAREIARRLGIPHISTGDMFRENVEKGTPVGNIAKSIMAAGELVNDDLVNEIVRIRLALEDCKSGFVLDGYPRTVMQAKELTEILRKNGYKEPLVIDLQISYNVVVRRLSGRRLCPVCNRTYNLSSQPPAKDLLCDDDGAPLKQRSDDREETVRDRLASYGAQAAPLVEFYKGQGRLIEVDADQDPQTVASELLRISKAVNFSTS